MDVERSDAWKASEGPGKIIGLPLVSLVLINWNYAAYVGAAIDSIKSQDYPNWESIIVDNGSTDESRDVIAKHVGEDSRFRIIHLESNVGQLGAFLETFELLRGDFVTIVDADDVLFSNFVSTHVQAHLALPNSVAFTSSNVVEINAAGRALTTSYSAFARREKPFTRGLRPVETTLRLSTVSEAEYLRLSRHTCTHVSGVKWLWGPGTSNMFRRSVLQIVHQKPAGGAYFRAADSYLNPLCHILGGSALIDCQLSGYRVHGENYFSEHELIWGLKNGRPEIRRIQEQQRRESIEFLFENAAHLQRFLPEARFWRAVDQISSRLRDKTGKVVDDADFIRIFVQHYATLRNVFGEEGLHAHLRQSLTARGARAVIYQAQGDRISPQRRLGHLASDIRFALSAWFSREPKEPKRAKLRETKMLKSKKSKMKKGNNKAVPNPASPPPKRSTTSDPTEFWTRRDNVLRSTDFSNWDQLQ